jgi:hypothetical protein
MPFTWTYSKLANFEDCPRRHYECDIKKTYREDDDNENLRWGNYVHDELAKACKGAPLPDELGPYQKWVDRVRRWAARPAGTVMVEQKIGYTNQFQPAAWMAPAVWWRGKADVLYVEGPVAVALDWKTGRIKEEPIQLGVTAQYLFSKYPDVQTVMSEYVWLKEETTSPEKFQRADMKYLWSKVLPRVQAYQEALTAQNFPPKPGGLCRSYCPVASCPFYRRGA